MRKLLLIVAMLAVPSGLVFAHSNGSKGLDDAKREFIEAKEDAANEKSEARRAEAVEKGKVHALKFADNLISRLEEIKDKVAECIEDEERAALEVRIDEVIASVEAVKAEIQGASNQTELRAAAQKLKDIMPAAREAATAVRDTGRKCRLEEILERLELAADRLEMRIGALTGDTSELSSLLDDAKEEHVLAQEALDSNDLKKALEELFDAKTILVKLNGQVTAAEAKEEGSNDQSENRPLFKEEE